MSDLNDFLKHNVEGYLFTDLRAMQHIEIGYPLLMTTFAGIELMGALLSTTAFHAHGKGADYFKSYWKNYLYHSLRDSEAIGSALYQLVRHGIAHGFVLKGPMAVVRNQSQLHLTRDASGLIYVDAVKLADDFMASYNTSIKQLASNTSAAVGAQSMSMRLSEMDTTYRAQAAKLAPSSTFPLGIAAATAAISQSSAPGAGPSGPSAPTFGSKLPGTGAP